MLHISLFSGIGGFDLASEWMGWTNIVSCEINPFGRKVLAHYWPEAYHHDDIHTLTYEQINEELTKRFGSNWRTDDIVLTGGFPCQPYSTAGKRLGKNDERHLWPQMLRVIQEVAPTYIVGENVRGIVNWNGGMVFDEVQADLEDAGYEVIPLIIPACAVNAPHRRDRVWFVAHSTSGNDRGRPGELSQQNEQQEKERPKKRTPKLVRSSEAHDAANTNGNGQHGCDCEHEVNPSEGRLDALGDADTGNEYGDAADTESRGNGRIRNESEEARSSEGNQPLGGVCGISSIADTNEQRLERTATDRNMGGQQRPLQRGIESGRQWQNFPTQPPVRFGNDGFSAHAHTTSISEERNAMDRDLVIKKCLEEGRLKADATTGKIYSLKQRGKEGQEIELMGSDCNGYIVHGIRYNGFKIQLKAHQIVWISANGLYDKSCLMIDHINRDRKDNRLENLRLVDAKGNRENATPYTGKLTEEQKDMMVWLHKEDGIPIRELAKDFGISKSRVHQIIQEHSGIYGITFSKWRNESIKAAGNAIVPQVAYQIFKSIQFTHDNL
jgi:DNA (cytosine-5)-methyltransferase 1